MSRTPAVEFRRKVVEEALDPVDDLAIALAARIGLLDPAQLLSIDLDDRPPVQLTVVALPQPRVLTYRHAGAAERDLRRLDGTSEI